MWFTEKKNLPAGQRTFADLVPHLKKFNEEKYLLPASDKLKADIPELLDELKLKWKRATLYNTVISDLSDLENVFYDVLVFFSPSGIESLFHNFPDFKQNKTRIAVLETQHLKPLRVKV